MRKYTIILAFASIIILVAGAGHILKINSSPLIGSIVADHSTSSGSLVAKKLDNSLTNNFLTEAQIGVVEYYRNTKKGFTREFGNVEIPSSSVNGDGVMINVTNLSNDQQGNLIIHGSVHFPKNVKDLHISGGLKYNNNEFIEAIPASPDRLTGDINFIDGDRFKEEVNHLGVNYMNREPSSYWYLVTYQYSSSDSPKFRSLLKNSIKCFAI
jgi:hypothetical protein